MQKNILIRSIAALSGIVMLASVAACGDNTASTPDSSSTDSASKTAPISGNFQGAGASSQQSAVEAWIAGFQGANPDAKIAYNPSGSGAGVQTFLTGATAWAGSDKALADDEVEQSKSVCADGTAFDVPVYVSPIAVIFNLKGVSDAGKHINMDADTIAKIFDGKITKWNDPAIADQNKDLTLPDTAITVVHRSDKSGTTQNFVSYFKDQAPDSWTYDLSENWPNEVGQGAKGTSGVVSTVKQADGTIGYADFSQVGDLGTVAVKVGDSYNEISAEAGSKVIEDSKQDDTVKGDNRIVIKINHATEAKGAYPIVLVSYDIVCPAYKDTKQAEFAKAWLTYVTSDEGQKAAQDAAGTAPLPSSLKSEITKSIEAIKTK
ncbi:MAG: phosphate ABC transporter substrate-binding protein PstS [Bifidobacterium breve]|mgnify:FL=1|uniref:phosphate ABC transporter substrate-binding protein PstS n=1 Tax=Bifidobacterium breve TaxID=1685 RepID=UPI0022AEB88C|nr:phosphate ABC transporter substrate-binding protein PstS [Bifidobacterium breve]MCZ4419854.1 phosphate ABC transporter substrate-binding protein PstS [Bifidobacterium breve]MCZ4423626.1 phosphate ABC transporter substrate-binding protein PstS [Bifidobacterium breve]MDK7090814.1 phosphate ABC transporter substrate-binding protein PstS [Bifidobacterium breve]MDU2059683.1 phosphate ABC transporter substrate-binding protein PstS [Bifidobacterium breve]MDU2069709.1 phosphate ABC transporter subs